ncbi:class III extradiol dioxygenase subunit B-like domain-containing protein [Actinocatenispora rupis]
MVRVIVSAAVCPHPPLLVPELATGGAADLAEVRAAAGAAVRALLDPGVEEVWILGAGADRTVWEADDRGTFAGYGRDVPVGLGGTGTGRTFTDLSVLVGAWLLRRTGVRRRAFTVPVDLASAPCAAIGRELAARSAARRVGLLAMGDAAARRAVAVPGAADPDADRYDASALAAVGSGDPAALLGLDPDLATRVDAAGRAAWQVLAGALGNRRYVAEVRYAGTPAEVTYLVATWVPA